MTTLISGDSNQRTWEMETAGLESAPLNPVSEIQSVAVLAVVGADVSCTGPLNLLQRKIQIKS